MTGIRRAKPNAEGTPVFHVKPGHAPQDWSATVLTARLRGGLRCIYPGRLHGCRGVPWYPFHVKRHRCAEPSGTEPGCFPQTFHSHSRE